MQKRFVSIWFRHLKTDWFIRRQPHLKEAPVVLTSSDHGRMMVTALNALAHKQGVDINMVLADARAIIPSLQVFSDEPERPAKLLTGFAEWFIRYTPSVAVDLPDGLILDATGCTHLWGSEKQYLTDIIKRLHNFGYDIRVAIADTIGAAWAIARFGEDMIVENGEQTTALLSLPPSALRLETETIELLEKLGLRQVNNFIHMPRSALRRRFGLLFLKKLDQALGYEEEVIYPIQPVEPYQERLPCLEPILTAKGIEIALEKLLDIVCNRLKKEEKGLRVALFKGYRVDGKIEKIEIGTIRPSCNGRHLYKLFEDKISTIEPAMGIELFIMEAPKVEDLFPVQEKMWEHIAGLDNISLSELLDRIAGKIGATHILRYLPDEHYWPERSFKLASSINEKSPTNWKTGKPRPLQMLPKPEPIEVTAPLPDYPPMLFRYKGKLHKILKADGPERIEPEWWLQDGKLRDYYYVEDEEGYRYWLFRSGHYEDTDPIANRQFQWFMHGFFA